MIWKLLAFFKRDPLSIREIKSDRKQILKMLHRYEFIDYIFVRVMITDEKYVDYPIHFYVNGYGKRKHNLYDNDMVYYISSHKKLLLENEKLKQFLSGSFITIEDYWWRSPMVKPYWLDNYVKTNLVYDQEFEKSLLPQPEPTLPEIEECPLEIGSESDELKIVEDKLLTN